MTPLEEFQQRQELHDPTFIRLFLEWLAKIRRLLGLDALTQAAATGNPSPIFQAIHDIGALELPHLDVALQEAHVATAGLPDPGVDLAFNPRDPNFETLVHDRNANALAEIDTETRSAVRLATVNAYHSSIAAPDLAPHLGETIGLTTRQTAAVNNQLTTMLAGGMSEPRALAAADAYAGRLRKQRATMIARTETIAAANLGRVAAYQQAQRNGWLPKGRSWLEWMAVQDDPREICFQLDGERWPVDEPGPMPPIHPNCRCVLVPVID